MGACLVFMTWAILSQPKARIVDFGFNFEFNPILIGICGHLVLFITGWVASRLFGGYRPDNVEDLTFYSHKLRADAAAQSAK
jgi:SSS family solute:Na+ symporter